jgi:glyoxylase-like metal-dependent hydrolase (beta-lactamase superfamily II)
MATTTWNEVGEHVYCRRYDPVDVTVSAVVGRDGVLIVDTRCDLAQAREIKADVARLTPLPIRWVVNTHAHFDHVWGNAEFDAPRAVPPAEFWAQENCPAQIDEPAGLPVRRPDRLVAEFRALDLGGRRVELRHLGRGHTDADLVLWLPEAGVLIAGDMIEESGPPSFGSDCFPLEWSATLEALMFLTEGDATYVPGHGDPVPHSFVVSQHEYVRHVELQVKELFQNGVTVEDALAAGAWPEANREVFANAVKRGYAQLSGEIPYSRFRA